MFDALMPRKEKNAFIILTTHMQRSNGRHGGGGAEGEAGVLKNGYRNAEDGSSVYGIAAQS
jgi:hypothetical protein